MILPEQLENDIRSALGDDADAAIKRLAKDLEKAGIDPENVELAGIQIIKKTVGGPFEDESEDIGEGLSLEEIKAFIAAHQSRDSLVPAIVLENEDIAEGYRLARTVILHNLARLTGLKVCPDCGKVRGLGDHD